MNFDGLLSQSAALHSHLCPRQVLGVRIGLLAGKLLGLELPRSDKRLHATVETDGCAADGISVATGCWVGRRTLRIVDFGKVAATMVDTANGHAVRIAPRSEARDRAIPFAPEATSHWEAQLLGYQRMPDDELLIWQDVRLTTPMAKIVSDAGLRVICSQCAEEVINERQIVREGAILCRACAGDAYYRVSVAASAPAKVNLNPIDGTGLDRPRQPDT
jgi:formylmethanofuran dehydrogenase subunit E